MSSLDNFQLATLGLGFIVLLMVFLEYNNKSYNEKVKDWVRIAEDSLPFIVAAYAIIQARNPDRMPKNIIYLIAVVSWWTLLARGPETIPDTDPKGGWRQVNATVTYNLAVASFFAVPIAFFGFLA